MKKLMVFVLIFINFNLLAETMNRESGGLIAPNGRAVFIDFASIGTGIDIQTYELTKNLITEAINAGKVSMHSTEYPGGLEGEVTLCVQFETQIDPNWFHNSQEFISALTPSVRDSNTPVRMLTAQSCKVSIEEAVEVNFNNTY